MRCEEARGELVAFHFGTVEDATRSDLREHLSRCPDCLREYFDIKAEVETASSVQRPSAEARARLRQAVLREVTGVDARPWAWWERPLAFGFASAAVVAAVFAVQVITVP